MKPPYIYKAEYVSKVRDQHYLNVDLGFRTWTVLPFYITNIKEEDHFIHGTKLMIQTKAMDSHKPRKYSCEIIE